MIFSAVAARPNPLRPGLLPLLFLGLFSAALLCFYRTGFFFFWDSWTHLWQLATFGFVEYVLVPDGEHFQPFAKLFFALKVLLFGSDYRFQILSNCLALACIGLALFKLLRCLGISGVTSASASFAYVTCYCNHELATIGIGLSHLLAVLFTLLALYCYFDSPPPVGPEATSAFRTRVGQSCLYALLASWSQGVAFLLTGFLGACLLGEAILANRKGEPWKPYGWGALAHLSSQLLVLGLWFGSKLPDDHLHPTVFSTIATAPSVVESIMVMASWLAYAVCMSIFPSLLYLCGYTDLPDEFLFGTIASGSLLLVAAWFSRATPKRAALKLGLYGVLCFLLIGISRAGLGPGHTSGYWPRYHTASLTLVLPVVLLIASEVRRRTAIPERAFSWVLAACLAALAVNGLSNSIRKVPEVVEDRMVVIFDYERLRGQLVTQQQQAASNVIPMPDQQFTHGHPFLKNSEAREELGGGVDGEIGPETQRVLEDRPKERVVHRDESRCP